MLSMYILKELKGMIIVFGTFSILFLIIYFLSKITSVGWFVILFLLVFAYFKFLRPTKEEREQIEARQKQLEENIKEGNKKLRANKLHDFLLEEGFIKEEDYDYNYDKICSSLEYFEELVEEYDLYDEYITWVKEMEEEDDEDYDEEID